MTSERLLLSREETGQLGNPKKNSSFEYVDVGEWLKLRRYLVEKSFSSNPKIKNEKMLAYSPGETLLLLSSPEVKKWHKEMSTFIVPKKSGTIILVPCAKTKPWDENNTKRSMLYRAYNRIRKLSAEGGIKPVFFVTLSEPLGVVPETFWSTFPQYDNPGLFKDDFLRTGIMRTDLEEFFGKRKALPFDKDSYRVAIEKLGEIVAKFLINNKHGRILSFVDGRPNQQSTHEEILDQALSVLNGKGLRINLERYTKRPGKLQSPFDHIISKI